MYYTTRFYIIKPFILSGHMIIGLKNPVKYSGLLPLLSKDTSLKFKNAKWSKNWDDGNLTIKDEIYTLIAIDNKRVLLYNNKNVMVDTKHLLIVYGKIV